MMSCARTLLWAVLFLLAGCASDISDMRLESVRPVPEMRLPTGGPAHDSRSDGLVAEFSSKRDLRRQVAHFATSFFVFVERCEGRTLIGDPVWGAERIGHEGFFDELGELREAGRGSVADPRGVETASGVPRNGRFFFKLAIPSQTFARRQPIDSAGYVVRSVIYHDLRRNSDDLCVFARGWNYVQGVWRSNTVVIPYADIRAALNPSSAP
jgi:hypothetical protein